MTTYTVTKNKSGNEIDYTYDANGNLLKDLNKDIGTGSTNGIVYNYLNLPQAITVQATSTSAKGTITYIYDAAGNKLQKKIEENIPASGTQSAYTKTTVTSYIGAAIYEATTPYGGGALGADVLKSIAFEEGRIRFEPATTNTCTQQGDRFVFDYFLRDNLGNVRMVLTEQNEAICYPAATLEDTRLAKEKKLYEITDSRIVEKNNTTSTSMSSFEDKVYRTHGGLTNEKTGLGIVLKVMSGDQVTIKAESFYTIPATGIGAPLNMAVDNLLSSFVGSNAIAGVKGAVSTTEVNGIGTNSGSFSNFLSRTPPTNTPKAYLNWILFDEQMHYAASSADPVASDGGYKFHEAFINAPVSVSKNGYLYVFVSNESNLPVYFDNLQVTHMPGAILEESQYYPMGMEIAAISSHALKDPYALNKEKYQEQEYEAALGLNMYEFEARQYDAQLGRWNVPDPAYQFASPYSAMANNWPRYTDPDGRFVHIIVGAAIGGIINVATHWNRIKSFKDGLVAFGIGAAAGALGTATGGASLGRTGLAASSIGGGTCTV